MNRSLFLRMGILLLCLCLLPVQTQAQTDLKSQGNEIVAGVVATVVVLGVVIGVVIHHANSEPAIKGCAVTGPNGLELKNEGDGQTFQLLGITSDVKPGDRVRVQGKKKAIGKSNSGNPTFLVEKLAKDYGACKAPSVKP